MVPNVIDKRTYISICMNLSRCMRSVVLSYMVNVRYDIGRCRVNFASHVCAKSCLTNHVECLCDSKFQSARRCAVDALHLAPTSSEQWSLLRGMCLKVFRISPISSSCTLSYLQGSRESPRIPSSVASTYDDEDVNLQGTHFHEALRA